MEYVAEKKPSILDVSIVYDSGGERGETLLALQFVVNRIVARQLEGEQLIILDAAGYRERRRNALVHLAERLASKAEKDQKVVKLSPMSPHDRRVFHRALTDNDGVRTRAGRAHWISSPTP